LAVLIASVVTLSALVFSQSATTSLRGTITDSKGAVVQGGTVTLSNPETGFSRSTTSGSDGVYQFLEVPPATYTITVTVAGFATIKRELIGAGFCPDCGYRGFVLGPRGGAAINIECGNVECRARFNITSHPHNHAFIVFCDRLPKEGEGGATWNEDGGSWSGDHR